MTSPNAVISTVEMMKPMVPEVISAVRIEISVFTMTFPISSVHSSRFPFFRTGRIFVAYSLSRMRSFTSCGSMLSPPTSSMFVSEIICSDIRSSPIRPRFRPLNRPEKHTRMAVSSRRRVMMYQGSAGSSVSTSLRTFFMTEEVGTPAPLSTVQYP